MCCDFEGDSQNESVTNQIQFTHHFINCPSHCSGGAHPAVPIARLYSLTLIDVEIPKSVITTLFG